MGMSLERVQFKFASIIGELCSQPDVLSQFAVWLDLRLAEYKLKGAISLDCSGEEPDPVWLKGLSKQKAPPRVNTQADRRTQSHSPSAYRSPSLHRPAHLSSDSDIPLSQAQSVPSAELAERLSPDVVVVKEEPDVYPVSLHAHENRKRSATDSVGVDFRGGSKQRRLSTTESPAHQSLMSVIGGFDNDAVKDSDNGGGNSDYPSTSTADIVTLPDLTTDMPADDLSFNKTAAEWADQADFSQDTTNTSETSAVMVQAEKLRTFVAYSRAKEEAGELRRKRISRIPNRENMSKSRLANITSTVALFERWLWDSHEHENRDMQDICPEELDVYLSEFFSTIRQPNGSNYSPGSLSSLRGYLEFYLRCTNYPASITGNSGIFQESQAAFRRKINEIKKEMAS